MIGSIINTQINQDAFIDVANATARVCRITAPQLKAELAIPNPRYRFDLSLTPRPEAISVRYSNHWSQHRSEPLGNFYIVPPNETLALDWETDTSTTQALTDTLFTSVIVHIDPELITGWLEAELTWSSSRLEKSLNVTDISLHALIKMIARETVNTVHSSKMMVELQVAQLAIEAGRFLAAEENEQGKGGLATWRLRRIEQRVKSPGKPPTLDELAELCNMSVRQLSRGFKMSAGCSIGSYIEEVRLENAKRLILEGEHIKSVAMQMGYSSQSNFSQAFRRATGMTPTYYQNRG